MVVHFRQKPAEVKNQRHMKFVLLKLMRENSGACSGTECV